MGIRRRPNIVIFFDVNMPREGIEDFKNILAELGIEMIFLYGENELDPKGEKPATMKDLDLLRYVERLLGKKYRNWRKGMVVFFYTADKGFITPIELCKIPQPNSMELRRRMILDMAAKLERLAPGLTARINDKLLSYPV